MQSAVDFRLHEFHEEGDGVDEELPDLEEGRARSGTSQ